MLVYFRFRNAQKLTTPMAQAIATAAIMAISVVMNGASAVGSVGSGSVGSGVVGSGVVGSGVVGVGSVGAGAVGCSGSIAAAGDGASVTPKYVVASELP